jgi:hypothetical protein
MQQRALARRRDSLQPQLREVRVTLDSLALDRLDELANIPAAAKHFLND